MRWLAWFRADSWHVLQFMELADAERTIEGFPEGTVWIITTTVGLALLRDMGVINDGN